ncbi:crotonase/enoyl-CoA hydratase family protein [Novosphingobium piscinae]|uniref:Crotonase/enoyl-CoA hydratase family protein n=1 Tax=Novosphingobium piscinae TaxID=1507448 RepID=A0A7X1FX67_9SPHN|nr:crotonase/enoyl-CoA hydratase family protein [Novosphingobium piscinae]MBC2668620.1 crotonase/enoyl-CoA hydratase family protein [Novosphingobium piscinae]
MTDDRVTLTVNEGIAEVRMNRPDKLNALDAAQFVALAEAIDALSGMPDLRCVVLSGEGRAFCVGADLQSLAGSPLVADLVTRTHGAANLLQHVAWGWRTLPVPVIAAVHGYAFGAGCQIMLGADLRILAPDAEVALMEIRWGLVPDMAGFALARGLVRDDHLRELVYTGRRVGAEEALRVGLASHVAADPQARALELARAIAAGPPAAVRAAKQLCNVSWETSDAALLLAEAETQTRLLRSPDHHAALRAAAARSASG